MNVTTTSSVQIWQKGDRTIWEVSINDGTQNYGLKTYSQHIAKVGFSGEVETYVNAKGDRFVRQVPKEPAPTVSAGASGASKPAYQPRDDAGIKAQFAIKAAIQATGPFNQDVTNYFAVVEKTAKELYAMIDRVKGSDHIANVQQAIPGATRVTTDGDPGPEYQGE